MNRELPPAILFDLDDTILSFGTLAEDAWKQVIGEYVPKLNDVSADALYQAVVERREWYWSDPERHRRGRLGIENAYDEIVRQAFTLLGIPSMQLATRLAEDYESTRGAEVKPFPGAVDTLRLIRDKGVKMALVTNGDKETQRGKINDHDLERFFDCIIVEGEFGVGKPNDEVYLHAMETLGVRPNETWMVGDNFEWEVVAPKRLGLTAIWVDSRAEGLPVAPSVMPDRIINSISELI
ncbi:MAG: HAD-IA family hydrolase [Chloroflexi bacterium]|nr:HAD-IA family hydrolase [Chloroflexota bacterium]MDA1227105.1 HAD-IA family hydrolase [Chloroflexota bacterium]